MLKNKIRAVTTAVVTAGAALTTVATASPATAANNHLCHNGTTIQGEVFVWENGGAVYSVPPGDCTPSSPGIGAFRPPTGSSLTYKYEGASDTQPLKKCIGNGQWCMTNGWGINVVSVRIGF